MATSLPWHHPLVLPSKKPLHHSTNRRLVIQSFRRGDFDAFKNRVASGEFWRDANNTFEQLVYETKKTAQSIDRRYSVSRRFSAAAQSAAYRAKELDNEFAITQRWRNFTLDWPRYRKQLSEFLDTPLGKSVGTVFFLWFALSGWLFRSIIFATWVLPFAGPLLIGAVANNLVIKGIEGGGNAAKAGLKVGDQVVYTSSFFGDELWPADKLGFTKTAIQAKPDSVYFVISRGADVDVKRLPKRPAPPRFGRKLSDAQKARASHICLDCGFIYTLSKPFDDQPEDYLCPQCRAPKKRFSKYDAETGKAIGGALPPIGVIIGLVVGIAGVGALLVYGLQ